MADLYIFSDHVAYALARRIEQEKSQARVSALTAIDAERIQRMEDALWALNEGTTDVNTASGEQLDFIGDIVGEPRLGRTDSVYRLWIKARGVANRSSGKPDDSLFILRLLLEPSAQIHYVDIPVRDAYYQIDISESSMDFDLITRILRQVKPAGVRFLLVDLGNAESFQYDAGPGYDVGKYAGVVGS